MVELTRRSFLIASACTALVPVISIPAMAAECPRQKAFRLADRGTREFYAGDGRYINTMVELLDHLPTVPGPNKSFGETVEEIGVVLRGTDRDGMQRNVDIMTCTSEAFAVTIVRDLLKNKGVHVVRAPNWKPFSKRYYEYIMKA